MYSVTADLLHRQGFSELTIADKVRLQKIQPQDFFYILTKEGEFISGRVLSVQRWEGSENFVFRFKFWRTFDKPEGIIKITPKYLQENTVFCDSICLPYRR